MRFSKAVAKWLSERDIPSDMDNYVFTPVSDETILQAGLNPANMAMRMLQHAGAHAFSYVQLGSLLYEEGDPDDEAGEENSDVYRVLGFVIRRGFRTADPNHEGSLASALNTPKEEKVFCERPLFCFALRRDVFVCFPEEVLEAEARAQLDAEKIASEIAELEGQKGRLLALSEKFRQLQNKKEK